MSGFSFRSLTFMLLVAFLVWSSNFEACMGRRGRHWRPGRASSSLSKKKGKTSHGSRSGSGSSSSHHHSGGSSGSKPKPKPKPKPKAPSHNNAPTPSHSKVPLPPPVPKPRDDDQGYSYNVLDFGAKGDGSSDDTKVSFSAPRTYSCSSETSLRINNSRNFIILLVLAHLVHEN